MSAWSEAFTKVSLAVQPLVEPVLTTGNGTTADPTKELDAIILASLRATTWTAGQTVVYGQIEAPVSRNGHYYRAVQGGVTGATEPSWPTGAESQVSDNTVVWEEYGEDYSSPYDTREAIRQAWELKASKASEYLKSSGADESVIYDRCLEQARRYGVVGVG
jgi:hypothetical protein